MKTLRKKIAKKFFSYLNFENRIDPYFGPDRSITVPYDPHYDRNKKHHSSTYYDASLMAMYNLLSSRGYSLAGFFSDGSNLYFVRNDKMGSIKAVEPKDTYVATKTREHRNKAGRPTYSRWENVTHELAGLPVLNTETGKEEVL